MSEQTATPRLTDQFAKAMVYAERKHHTQVRKGGDIPYVGHLLSVAGLVINDDGSEAQTIADRQESGRPPLVLRPVARRLPKSPLQKLDGPRAGAGG
jgi:hypothetical protein